MICVATYQQVTNDFFSWKEKILLFAKYQKDVPQPCGIPLDSQHNQPLPSFISSTAGVIFKTIYILQACNSV